MKIAAVGDIMPGGVLAGINEGYVSEEIKQLLASADIRVGTLETAVGNEPTFYEEKMRRKADVIYVKDSDLIKLKQLQFDVVSLANNHFFDLGPGGAAHTIELLDELGIKHVGAGKNLEEASKPVVIEKDGKSVAFLAFCDWREANVGWCPFATETEAGICPMYDDFVIEQIKSCKSKYDYVVVMPHWGKEYTNKPNIDQYRLARKMLKAGAAVIAGSHTHSIQPYLTSKNYCLAFCMGNYFFPDRILNYPRSTWYPEAPVDVKKLPLTDGFPYVVETPTFKIWKPIARQGLMMMIELIGKKVNLQCYRVFLDSEQYLTVTAQNVKYPLFAILYKIGLYPLCLFIERIFNSIKCRTKRIISFKMTSVFRSFKRLLVQLYNNLVVKPQRMMQLRKQTELFCHVSYFPELSNQRKSEKIIYREQLSQIAKYGAPNYFYFPYGFDVKSEEEMAAYFHYSEFADLRRDLLKNSDGSAFVLRNKFVFGIFTESLGVKSGHNTAIISREMCVDLKMNKPCSLDEVLDSLEPASYFSKLIDGECGVGIFKLRKEGNSLLINEQVSDRQKINELIKDGKYLIQGLIQQHSEMSRLYPNSVNTLRLVTVKSGSTGKITVLPSILRIGANGSIVDNTSQGGLAVGINLNDGHLFEYGFYKPQFGTKVKSHPNSRVVFKDFVVPFFEKAKEQAVFLHSMLPGLAMIGWDIAIGEEGPVFVEGNDNWEINGPQICNGGMKELVLAALK